MELNINLKDEQKEFLDQVVEELSLVGIEQAIQRLINKILNRNDNENVFGEIRCIGGCFSNDKSVKIELDEDIIKEMKDIFSKYDYEDYDSEEEQLGKVIRSIINFVDEEGVNNVFNR